MSEQRLGLHNLKPAAGSNKPRTRIARGQGSGKGGTATKGHKGANSRTGFSYKVGFEGGQNPYQRRIPKFGFRNINRVEYNIINLDQLQAMVDADPALAQQPLTPERLFELGQVPKMSLPLKVLGKGELKQALTIKAHKFSGTAQAAIEKVGGQAQLLSPETETE